MRFVIGVCLLLAFIAALVAALFLHVPVEVLLTWGMGLLSLLWQLILVTLPWNIHFKARHLLHEMDASRERGIPVPEDRRREATHLARRSLLTSVTLHLLSAMVMALITRVSGSTWGYYFSGFYLLSTFFRPALEFHRFLWLRLQQLLSDVRYPRDDIVTVKAQLQELQADHKALLHRVERDEEAHAALARELSAAREEAKARDRELDLKLSAISRKFEETVSRLTDNQEVISGIKAFLRLIQDGRAP